MIAADHPEQQADVAADNARAENRPAYGVAR